MSRAHLQHKLLREEPEFGWRQLLRSPHTHTHTPRSESALQNNLSLSLSLGAGHSSFSQKSELVSNVVNIVNCSRPRKRSSASVLFFTGFANGMAR